VAVNFTRGCSFEPDLEILLEELPELWLERDSDCGDLTEQINERSLAVCLSEEEGMLVIESDLDLGLSRTIEYLTALCAWAGRY